LKRTGVVCLDDAGLTWPSSVLGNGAISRPLNAHMSGWNRTLELLERTGTAFRWQAPYSIEQGTYLAEQGILAS